MKPEKSYVELKVTFVHIIVMVVGIIVIGAFLFYLGYQAGQSSNNKDSDIINNPDTTEEIRLSDNNEKDQKKQAAKRTQAKKDAPSISDEIRLHKTPSAAEKPKAKTPPKPQPKKQEKIKPKEVTRESYYAIQVGAFSEQTRTRKYAAKFQKMGYPIDIISTKTKKNKTLYRIRVGNFANKAEARKEKNKLEKMEKSKFKVVKPN